MNRKFTDNELRAYNKNRFEDRILKKRVNRLKDEIGTYHDSSSKTRSNLIEECKTLRLTTGGSPSSKHYLSTADSDFDLSSRVKRPWAYSVMETTYNTVYLEAIIPIPKQHNNKIFRSKSASTGLMNTTYSRPLRSECPSQRSILKTPNQPSDAAKRFMLNLSFSDDKDLKNKQAKIVLDRSVSNPEIRLSDRPISGINMAKETILEEEKMVNDECTKSVEHGSHENINELTTPDNSSSKAAFNYDDEVDGYKEYKPNFGIEIDRKPNTQLIALPPVYKIDSKAYQEAERERLIYRSHSRATIPDTEHTRVSTREPTKDKAKLDRSELSATNNHILGNHELENTTSDQSHKTIPELLSDKSIQENDSTVQSEIEVAKDKGNTSFRGSKLRNYIRPEERYKYDPNIMKRRQNRMDKLSKESAKFLKRVNHENLSVDLYFPRSARSRIRTQLVRENNSSKGRKLTNDDAPFIQAKVNDFMVSISDYIQNQKLT